MHSREQRPEKRSELVIFESASPLYSILVRGLYDHHGRSEDLFFRATVRGRERQAPSIGTGPPQVLIELQIDIPETALVAKRSKMLA
jgi:hypothetical protein